MEQISPEDLELLLETIREMNEDEIIRYSRRFGWHPRVEAALVRRVKALQNEARRSGMTSAVLREAVRLLLGS